MERNYINKNRYKSISKTSKQKRDVKINTSVKSAKKIKLKDTERKIDTKHLKNSKKTSDNNTNKKYKNNFLFNSGYNIILSLLKITFSVAILIGIGYISKKIIFTENNSISQVFSKKEEKSSLENEYNFKVGVASIGEKDIVKSSNILLNELSREVNLPLIKIKENYEVEYILLEKYEKIDETNYHIYLNKSYGVSNKDIIDTINLIKSLGDNNPYYSNVSNIAEVKEENEGIRINIKTSDPYYIFTLTFPIYSATNFSNTNLLTLNKESSFNDSVMFLKNNNNNLVLKNISSINVKEYNDTDNMAKEFVNKNLDMFLTSSYSVMQMLGKHEYNVKKVRSGETLFLLGNPDSVLYKQSEIRKAIAFSINKEEIIKYLEAVYADPIDIPYIYSGIKYKYDITGAENLLISNSWKKSGGIYSKIIDGNRYNAEVKILVNETDEIKIRIADKIKEMVEKIGIRINIEKYSKVKIEEKINAKDYDFVLADVNLSENPNTSFLEKHIALEDRLKQLAVILKDSNENVGNIKEVQEIFTSEVLAIGIYAKNINVVYQKYIGGFDEKLTYMNIFSDFRKIGKNIK